MLFVYVVVEEVCCMVKDYKCRSILLSVVWCVLLPVRVVGCWFRWTRVESTRV